MVQLQSAGSLAQALSVMVQASAMSSADASKLTALVQSSSASEDSDMEVGAPDPAVYESKSGGIVSTLEGLLDEARKKETAALHNFEMLKQSLEDQMKFANEDMAETKQGLAEAKEAKAVAEGDLEGVSKELAEDIKSLAELHHDCMSKATSFEEEVKSRGEELKALATAKKIIQESTGGAAAQTYDLAQLSFVQVAASTREANFQVVHLVRGLARKQHSAMLTQLASRMESAITFGSTSGGDPFEKVRGLISDMLARLQDEAAADATEKAFCDKEMSETTAKKDEKDADIEKMTTKIDQMTAQSAKLIEEVATLQKELAALASEQAEMDALREKENAAYKENHPEMEQGLEGLKLALKVLREYYAKDDKNHEAAEGAASGIIGLLEVAEADFSKGLSEMIAEEDSAAAAYEKETKENEITKAAKDQDVKYKSAEAKKPDQAVAELSTDRDSVHEELAELSTDRDSV